MRKLIWILLVLGLVACQPTVSRNGNMPMPSPSPTSEIACPQIQHDLIHSPEYEILSETEYWQYEVDDPIEYLIRFLNNGGDFSEIKGFHDIEYIDLTGDGAEEILVDGLIHNNIHIFSCEDGEYFLLDRFFGEEAISYDVYDMNNNGVVDLVLRIASGMGAFDVRYFIVEWDGTEFEDLIQMDYCAEDDTCDPFPYIMWPLYAVVDNEIFYDDFRDIDQNGTIDLILYGGKPTGTHGCETYPHKMFSQVFVWNGEFFEHGEFSYINVPYRFQYIEIGDNYFRTGKYDKAIGAYKRVLNDESLLGWSTELRAYWFWWSRGEQEPLPPADPNEYERLAAYASLRIMQIHLLQKNEQAAQLSFDALTQKYIVGNAGYPYAQATKIWWETYQNSDLESACDLGNRYWEDQRERLYFWEWHEVFEWEMQSYEPLLICPIGVFIAE